jgi:hypothetical protein
MSDPSDRAERYEIRIVGHLAPRWIAFFDGMTIAEGDDGTTVMRGPVADQSALHGLIRKIGDLGLALISVRPTDADEPTSSTTDPN